MCRSESHRDRGPRNRSDMVIPHTGLWRSACRDLSRTTGSTIDGTFIPDGKWGLIRSTESAIVKCTDKTSCGYVWRLCMGTSRR